MDHGSWFRVQVTGFVAHGSGFRAQVTWLVGGSGSTHAQQLAALFLWTGHTHTPQRRYQNTVVMMVHDLPWARLGLGSNAA